MLYKCGPLTIKYTVLYETTQHLFHSYHAFFTVDQVKFGPPLRKVTEPYPDMVMHFFMQDMFVTVLYTDGIHEYKLV